MEFYDGLRDDVIRINEFVRRISEGDNSASLMYTVEQIDFIKECLQMFDDRTKVNQIINGCIENQTWGLLAMYLAEKSLYGGVDTFILNQYIRIPAELRASLVSIVCYEYKWSNEPLNDLFVELVISEGCVSDSFKESSEEYLEVYYPLGWNETAKEALNNPCWFLSEGDAIAYCLYSKLFFAKSMNLGDYHLFGNGEIEGIDHIKTRILSGSIKKKDVLEYLSPCDFLPDFSIQKNIIQNQAVMDIKETNESFIELQELNIVDGILAMNGKSDESYDDFYGLAEKYLFEIKKLCEMAGLPAYETDYSGYERPAKTVKEISSMIRGYSRMTPEKALENANEIMENAPGAEWTKTASIFRETLPGKYYRGIAYSVYMNKYVTCYCHDNGHWTGPIPCDEEEIEHFVPSIYAIDLNSESDTLEECMGKRSEECCLEQMTELSLEEENRRLKKRIEDLEFQVMMLKAELES